MKRTLLTLATSILATLGLSAQQTLEVYSAYDVNQDTKVQVEDVTTVVNATLANSTIEDKTVVDAAKLNALLLDIYQKLEKLEKLEAEHAEIMAKLDYCSIPADENGVRTNGHEYVDLGLKDEQGRSIYWATCNIGAEKPEDAGLYFAWGETQGYTGDTNDGRSFDWESYKWCHGTNVSITKYSTNFSYGIEDNKTILDLEDDAAHANWGADWRMPTRAEQDQLRAECKWTWDSEKNGYNVIGSNGNSIFVPVTGQRKGSDLINADRQGFYWSSSLSTTDGSDEAYSLGFFLSVLLGWNHEDRTIGRVVRAVCVSQN